MYKCYINCLENYSQFCTRKPFIPLLLSAATSSKNTSDKLRLAAICAHAIAFHPPSLTDHDLFSLLQTHPSIVVQVFLGFICSNNISFQAFRLIQPFFSQVASLSLAVLYFFFEMYQINNLGNTWEFLRVCRATTFNLINLSGNDDAGGLTFPWNWHPIWKFWTLYENGSNS